MTTKPKTKKFRIRKSSPLAGRPAPAGPHMPDSAPQRGGGDAAYAAPATEGGAAPDLSEDMQADIASATETATETDIAAIRREGLTGRQLRMARRLAQKHDLTATSDFDAVRQLRAADIDPFERANMLELVVPEQGGGRNSAGERVQLPQTVKREQLPSTERAEPHPPLDDRAARDAQIRKIQTDIARRRRKKLVLLGARLAFFVLLPTFIAGWYYYVIATPMYATKSEFVIQQANGTSPGGLGGLFSGTGFATSQDSIAVQSYLQSREAMQRLDADVGFKAHFSQDWIDPIQRLPENATNDDAYEVYKDNVEIGYDPTEGIIRMEVVAANPEVSALYSERLIDYAEERVDNLTQRLREDQMSGARASYEKAEARMEEAQARVLKLQERLGVLDPAAESGAIMGQVQTFETQLQQKQLELEGLLANRRPNQARVDGVRGEISRLEDLVADLRSRMTETTGDAASLARISAQLRQAETGLQTRIALMQQALQQLETARIEANRQVRYLSLGVSPIPPDEATYPRAFENTLLAFLIFSGIYLMLSLTASILREQVSA